MHSFSSRYSTSSRKLRINTRNASVSEVGSEVGNNGVIPALAYVAKSRNGNSLQFQKSQVGSGSCDNRSQALQNSQHPQPSQSLQEQSLQERSALHISQVSQGLPLSPLASSESPEVATQEADPLAIDTLRQYAKNPQEHPLYAVELIGASGKRLEGMRKLAFMAFWQAWADDNRKAKAIDAWSNLPDLRFPFLELIIKAAKAEARLRAAAKDDLNNAPFRRQAAAWLAERGWEDQENAEEIERHNREITAKNNAHRFVPPPPPTQEDFDRIKFWCNKIRSNLRKQNEALATIEAEKKEAKAQAKYEARKAEREKFAADTERVAREEAEAIAQAEAEGAKTLSTETLHSLARIGGVSVDSLKNSFKKPLVACVYAKQNGEDNEKKSEASQGVSATLHKKIFRNSVQCVHKTQVHEASAMPMQLASENTLSCNSGQIPLHLTRRRPVRKSVRIAEKLSQVVEACGKPIQPVAEVAPVAEARQTETPCETAHICHVSQENEKSVIPARENPCLRMNSYFEHHGNWKPMRMHGNISREDVDNWKHAGDCLPWLNSQSNSLGPPASTTSGLAQLEQDSPSQKKAAHTTKLSRLSLWRGG